MNKRMLISLGGNALGVDYAGLVDTARVVSAPVAALMKAGHRVIICHGNGPQVGILKTSLDTAARLSQKAPQPLSECVAMSQSFIGMHLQNEMQNALKAAGVQTGVVTVVTRALVDADDPGFSCPTKPVGAFMTEEEAEKMREQGKTVVEDSGRGYREVVASPRPLDIIEKDAVKALLDAGQLVIAGGGGGIPVVEKDGAVSAVDAVIDKDFTSVMLAENTGCDMLVILTGVEKVAVHFNRPDRRWLDRMTAEEARAYIAAGEFPAGSMLPKVEAALAFVTSGAGRSALITSLDKLPEGIAGETGTLVVAG